METDPKAGSVAHTAAKGGREYVTRPGAVHHVDYYKSPETLRSVLKLGTGERARMGLRRSRNHNDVPCQGFVDTAATHG